MINQKQELWSWIIFFLIVGAIFLYTVSAHPQTLQRRPSEIPTLHPESCRDHVARTRHEFLEAAQWTTNDERFRDNLVRYYLNAGDPHIVAKICSNKKLEGSYDVHVAAAIYTSRIAQLVK